MEVMARMTSEICIETVVDIAASWVDIAAWSNVGATVGTAVGAVGDAVGAAVGWMHVETDGYSFGHHDPNVMPAATCAELAIPAESVQHLRGLSAAFLNS